MSKLVAGSARFLVILIASVSIGCGGGTTDPPADTTAGDTTAGDTTAGDTTAGDTTAGDTTAGDTTAGDTTAGDTTAGDTTAGDTTAGDTTPGDTTPGDTTTGDTTTGDTTTGDTTPGDTTEDCPNGEEKDCAGVCGGDAVEDMCGTCDNDATNDCVEDCNGDWGGDAVEDMCGTCDNDATNDCVEDCNGDFGGLATEDNCGVCDEDTTNDDTTCAQDCNGDWGGLATSDDCGVCDEDSSNDNTTCALDCNGDADGTAYLNECGDCVGGNVCHNVTITITTSTYFSEEISWSLTGTDLFGPPEGETYEDSSFGEEPNSYSYNTCLVGGDWTIVTEDGYGDGWGTTANLTITDDTSGAILLSETDCADLGVSNTPSTEEYVFTVGPTCAQDCAGEWNGGNTTDDCGVCDADSSNDNTLLPDGSACVQDCAGVWNGDSLEDECGTCDNDPTNDGATDMCGTCDTDPTNDCVVDCNGDLGGTAYIDECDNCVAADAVSVEITTTTYAYEGNWELKNAAGDILATGPTEATCATDEDCTAAGEYCRTLTNTCEYSNNTIVKVDVNVPAGDYTLFMYDSFGDGWDVTVSVLNTSTEETLAGPDDSFQTGTEGSVGFTVAPGCFVDCAGDQNGASVLDACGVCDADDTNDNTLLPDGSACVQDCAMTWNGTATTDDCGVCDDDPDNDNLTCIQDCNGDWNGTAFEDECGNCIATTNLLLNISLGSYGYETSWSIPGTAFSGPSLAACGSSDDCPDAEYCTSGACKYSSNQSFQVQVNLLQGDYQFVAVDSYGDGWGSSASFEITNSGGDVEYIANTTFTSSQGDPAGELLSVDFTIDGPPPCVIDCAGEVDGPNLEDNCGVCDADPSNDDSTCSQDCNAEWGGSAEIDQCGACVGGTTGKETTLNECGQCCVGGTVNISTGNYGYETSWLIEGTSFSGSDYASYTDYNIDICLYPGPYTFSANDSWGDGWNGGSFGVSDLDGNALVPDTLFNDGANMTADFTIPGEVCGGTGDGEPDHSVTIVNFEFAPAALTVTVGDVVEFCNEDSAVHTATDLNASWDTGNIESGECALVTFDTVGEYSYLCAFHPTMTGIITVLETVP